jgi:hypothetical protein
LTTKFTVSVGAVVTGLNWTAHFHLIASSSSTVLPQKMAESIEFKVI